MTYPELMQQLKEENKHILANDPRFDFSILIVHDDGILIQEHAFAEQRGEYLVAFGEHMPPTAFDVCAVRKWAIFEYTYPEEDLMLREISESSEDDDMDADDFIAELKNEKQI